MSVWLTIPSKRPAAEAEPVLRLWRKRGYKIALWRDIGDDPLPGVADLVEVDQYPGYAKAANYLIRRLIATEAAAEWFVVAGDDTEPDSDHTAEEIAEECCRYFREHAGAAWSQLKWARTWGVMQPTGDRWGDEPWSRQRWPDAPAYIDRIAGSPWIGREFARRMYGGRGPLYEGYYHMFEDEELQNVATRLDVFWQRPDLTHYHHHWMREGKPEPAFLVKANAEFEQSRCIFESRRAADFPGHEPIA